VHGSPGVAPLGGATQQDMQGRQAVSRGGGRQAGTSLKKLWQAKVSSRAGTVTRPAAKYGLACSGSRVQRRVSSRAVLWWVSQGVEWPHVTGRNACTKSAQVDFQLGRRRT
jgi:hypothetical protein